MCWVAGVFEDRSGPFEAAGARNLFRGEQRAANNPLGCVYDPLQSLPFCSRAPRVPRQDAVHEFAHYRGAIEGHQQLLFKFIYPENSQRVQSLLGLLRHCLGVHGLGEPLSEMWTPKNLKDDTLSTQSPLMWRGALSTLILLKSMMISLDFVVFSSRLLAEHHTASSWTSSLQAVSSLPVLSLTTVVLLASLMMELEGVQSDVYRAYGSGLSTQP